MACIKGVNRSASVALAPDAPYMAAGTMAGAVDLSFSSSANLEIFKFDFQSDDLELPVIGECPSSERFNRLAWGKNGSGSDEFSLGLIAGGLVDGSIDLWNPLKLIRSEANDQALVGHLSRHKGPVRGLEFNAIAPNLLASGADDGEICIWDLAAPAQPSHFPPLKGSGSASQGEISYLSWNSKVQHILASTSYNGTTVVWDLKKQKPVISFADSIRRRCSVLQWHPDVATQLVVASDEDGSPMLRLWDMRNIMSPVKEFAGHTKGVIAMAWCPSDSSYLLTCAKDNRTICWDTVTGEAVCELPAGTNWNFDVHWYPKIPGIVSASSFDGKIGIYNIEGCSRYGVGDSDFGTVSLRAPKWYKRPVGASFGFGGKLVSFRTRSSGSGTSASSEVFLHNLVAEETLVSRSSEFESVIQSGERSSLRVLCEKKEQESESQDDRETWGFLKVMFEDDGTARTKLLMHLGFSLPEEKDTVQDNISQIVNDITLEDKVAEKVGYEGEKEAAPFAVDNGEDFFNNLPSPKADTPVSTSENNFAVESTVSSTDLTPQEPGGVEESSDPSFDDAVQRALVVGDYKGAVAQCIAANKMADALVIAHVGDPSLWASTCDQYLKMSRSPYLKVVSAMVNNDLMSLVNTRPLKFWKETLALLCTFAQREEWTVLCDTLASKLMAYGNTLAATLCYICAGNIDKTVEIWSRCLTTELDGKSYVDLLQDIMEKTIVLALATGQKRFSASLCKLVEKYAEILASQGLLTTAMEYLKLLGSDDLSPELVILKDRIALSTEPVKEGKSAVFENSHPTGVPGFAPSQHIYPDPAAPQIQPSVPGSAYDENYQRSFSQYGGYAPPPSYLPQAPPANMFVPTQAPHISQTNFAPPPETTQPTVRPFVPSNPPVLRNADQYQQPTSLGSQLYPGAADPTYPAPPGAGSFAPVPSQMGAAPGPRMPQVVAPAPAPRGFMPVTNTSVQRPGMGPMQPPSTTQSASVQPAAAPAAPPPTVQTADTSNVPAHQKPVITTLTRLFNETSQALGGARANPVKKREIEDNSKKIGALFAKLNSGDISKNASDKLIQLCQALDNNDFGTALQIQVLLTTSEWDECNFWLATLKRMIKTRQNLYVRILH
ncbi:protein transport protein SEC31-like protein B-like isoform X1 [Gossypium australe]|uniref:Protein transport protein SEC31-like protein B-like isoform X1 n=2 Tax=Gossypium TaxID=3633 RepID=A0A5B6VKF6_9ROSI|nr:protein transport protein SEC31-like protein B-like isoform X1 [Gossypium australe]KAA3469495.1 protein transport protein SEC31-like protein B-like isoform X1 [Gossypium australe]